MKCPNCSTEMVKGNLVNDGRVWAEKILLPGLAKWSFRGLYVFAFRCPKCQKIELQADAPAL